MSDEVQTIIVPSVRDLGDGFLVKRALPSGKRMMVGPFIFFDQFGPVDFQRGHGLDVRPHPHIGLATVTYLFAGEILHRDSLGSVQLIRPGEVNWMTAGRGIVHSERSAPETRAAGGALSGIQLWVALPRDQEECAPSFTHYPASALPILNAPGVTLRLMAGSILGMVAPTQVYSPMFYADAELAPGADFHLPPAYAERALYVAEGAVEIAGRTITAGQLVVLQSQGDVRFSASTAARLLLLGGQPLSEPRHIWWNFVSSSLERIREAKAEWQAGRFAKVPEETEWIPAPEQGPAGAV